MALEARGNEKLSCHEKEGSDDGRAATEAATEATLEEDPIRITPTKSPDAVNMHSRMNAKLNCSESVVRARDFAVLRV